MFSHGWIGFCVALAGTLILVLCNHDGYHFYWLVSVAYPLIVLAFVAMSISWAPPALAKVLKAEREAVRSVPRALLVLGFFWVAAFFALGAGYIKGLEMVRQAQWGLSANADGKVAALGRTSSKGGAVEWAIYEYAANGVKMTSAVRNGSLGLGPGQRVAVAYARFWPRYSFPQAAAGPVSD